jgi:dipeptidyl aminopeptidase/acylaminoacyl peptidase
MERFRRALFVIVSLFAFTAFASAVHAQAAAAKQAPPKSATSKGSAAPGAKSMKSSAAESAMPGDATHFTIEQVLDFAFPVEGSLIASPKGDRIAWAEDLRGVRNIYGAEAPGWAPHQITHYDKDDGQEIGELCFTGDGGAVVYTRGGGKNREGEIPDPDSDPAGVSQAVWVVSWAGGAQHRIDTGESAKASPASTATSGWIAYTKEDLETHQDKIWIAPVSGGKAEEVYVRGVNGGGEFGESGNGGVEWSPDGKRFAFVSIRSGHSIIGIYDAARKDISYVAPTVDLDSYPRWSPDGKSIAFIRRLARGEGGRGGVGLVGPDQANPWAIWVYDVASDKAHEVWHSGHNPDDSVPGVPGNTTIAWGGNSNILLSSEQTGWQHMYTMPVSGGEPKDLMTGDCEYEYMHVTNDGKYVVFNSNCGTEESKDIDRRHLWIAPTDGSSPAQALTSGETIEWWPVTTASGKWVAYFASGPKHPGTPYVRALNPSAPTDGTSKALAELPKDFPLDKLVVPQQVIIHAADGTPVHCQLFLPADLKAGEKLPGIVFMHGGPPREMLLGWHYMQYYSNSYGMNQYLANHGYVVMSVNYRSGIGYGRDFRMAKDRGSRGASEYQDIVAAGNYLRNRDDVQPDHVGLWGGSYGGYLTAMGLARNSDIFAAGVDFHGVHDWSARIGAVTVPNGMAPQSEAARIARESSPVASIDTWRSPVLLIQGDDDRNVDFSQMIELVPMLRQHHVEFEQLVFPDEIHDFLMWKTWVHGYEAGADFFNRKLKGESGTSTAAGGSGR